MPTHFPAHLDLEVGIYSAFDFWCAFDFKAINPELRECQEPAWCNFFWNIAKHWGFYEQTQSSKMWWLSTWVSWSGRLGACGGYSENGNEHILYVKEHPFPTFLSLSLSLTQAHTHTYTLTHTHTHVYTHKTTWFYILIDFLQADVLVEFLLIPTFILFTLPQLLISVSLYLKINSAG